MLPTTLPTITTSCIITAEIDEDGMGESCPVSPLHMTQPVAPMMTNLPPAARPKQAKASRPSSSSMRVWEYEEDQMLLAAVAKMGKRWRAIARLFPDRSEAMCRNRYTRIFAPHRPEMKGWKPSVNRCNACGQYKKGHSCASKGKLFVNASGDTCEAGPLAQVPTFETAPALEPSVEPAGGLLQMQSSTSVLETTLELEPEGLAPMQSPISTSHSLTWPSAPSVPVNAATPASVDPSSALSAASRTAEAVLDDRVSVADLLFRLDSSDTHFLSSAAAYP